MHGQEEVTILFDSCIQSLKGIRLFLLSFPTTGEMEANQPRAHRSAVSGCSRATHCGLSEKQVSLKGTENRNEGGTCVPAWAPRPSDEAAVSLGRKTSDKDTESWRGGETEAWAPVLRKARPFPPAGPPRTTAARARSRRVSSDPRLRREGAGQGALVFPRKDLCFEVTLVNLCSSWRHSPGAPGGLRPLSI